MHGVHQFLKCIVASDFCNLVPIIIVFPDDLINGLAECIALLALDWCGISAERGLPMLVKNDCPLTDSASEWTLMFAHLFPMLSSVPTASSTKMVAVICVV